MNARDPLLFNPTFHSLRRVFHLTRKNGVESYQEADSLRFQRVL